MTKAHEILSKLVSFPILGGYPNLSIIEYIENFLSERNISSHRIYNAEKTKASLHARIGPAVDGGIILSGHTDVVPVAGQDWSTDPFELIEKPDGRLYARGSADMKGFLACCLANVDLISSLDLKRPIYLAFSYDEEIGCIGAPDLVKAINEHYAEKPKFAIIGEPSMMQPIVGQKGICIYQTTVNGSAGHSSRIRQEVSAVHEAMRLAMWLENKMNELIADGHTDDRFTPEHTSIHIGKIHGGIAPNVIADQCVFTWDVRTIPMDMPQAIHQEFIQYCAGREVELRKTFEDFTIETQALHPAVPGLDTDADDEVVSLIKKWTGNDYLQTVSYAAEAGQFAEGGFQSVICGPGDIMQAHRADEFISKEQLEKGAEFIATVARSLT
ncbi:MAG: acetylornithine deacetylase [Cyclobacteriaceae bacterium]